MVCLVSYSIHVILQQMVACCLYNWHSNPYVDKYIKEEKGKEKVKGINGDVKKMKKHLLFLCSANIDRSPAAESLFKNHSDYEAKSAGISKFAQKQVTREMIAWADVIFVMDERNEQHKTQLLNKFPKASNKEIIILNISNDFVRNDPELERLLRTSLEREGYEGKS